MNVEILVPRTSEETLGLIPHFLHDTDARPAREQLDANYSHGGGWSPMPGFKMFPDKSIQYPGDPPMQPIARMKLREETIYVYPYAWVAIVKPDGKFEISRMD